MVSKRPGRTSALSSTSGKLVAPMTMTPSFWLKPSNSTSNWLSVIFIACWSLGLRCEPIASISSMKMMHGASARACAKRSRTRLGPTPTNISMKSEPEMLRKGTDASPAVALASSVLPVPGGPTSSAPLGMRAPSFANFSESLRNLTNSAISSLASSQPATSLKVTSGRLSALITCGLALPTWKMERAAPPMPPPPPLLPAPSPPEPRMSSSHSPTIARLGPILMSSFIQLLSVS
mmetsp:Transcript_30896/g.71975  ORF Transcript_30896/g.71975 Transcript_30896/m.71975 type:complete len:235 (-) Transcript_30896:443-1147(-)